MYHTWIVWDSHNTNLMAQFQQATQIDNSPEVTSSEGWQAFQSSPVDLTHRQGG